MIKMVNEFKDSVGAYHLAKKSGNFGLRSNGKAIFRKIYSEIVDHLERYSVRNGIWEMPLPFARIVPFPGPFPCFRARSSKICGMECWVVTGKRHSHPVGQ